MRTRCVTVYFRSRWLRAQPSKEAAKQSARNRSYEAQVLKFSEDDVQTCFASSEISVTVDRSLWRFSSEQVNLRSINCREMSCWIICLLGILGEARWWRRASDLLPPTANRRCGQRAKADQQRGCSRRSSVICLKGACCVIWWDGILSDT